MVSSKDEELSSTVRRNFAAAGRRPHSALVDFGMASACPLALAFAGCLPVYSHETVDAGPSQSNSGASATTSSSSSTASDAASGSTGSSSGGSSSPTSPADSSTPASSSSSSSGGSAASCQTGATQCVYNGVQTCTNGAWGSVVPCPPDTPICNTVVTELETTAGVCGEPPSCQGDAAGTTDCGRADGGAGDGGTVAGESCCASLEVAGGTYYRTYTNGGTGATDEADPASVSSFRLDKYLVTVGRFRQFVTAWNNGYLTTGGLGKHVHLNDGDGLANSAAATDAGGPPYETGWNASAWNNATDIDPTTANLGTCGYETWTPTPGSQENLPINCVTWWEAYAFCIWDGGGFLPSEAEWEYAAAGGSDELEYPWGSTAPGMLCPGTGCSYAIYGCYTPSGSGSCGIVANIAPVGTATLGVGFYGQMDMAGELYEWTMDYSSPYLDPCTDCAYLTAAPNRVIRGGSFADPTTDLLPPYRATYLPNTRGDGVGFRCARTP